MTETSFFYKKYYKPLFDKIQKYIPESIHPNVLTLSCFIIINTVYVYKLYKNPYYLSIIMLLYFFLDNLDGVHARATKQTSRIGEILDHCIDGYMVVLLITVYSKIFIKDIYLQNILLIVSILTFNIKHLIHKYKGKLSLGFKYFSIDEINLLCTIIPFLTFLNIPDIFYSYVAYIIIGSGSISLIKDISKLKNIKLYDIIPYIGVGLLPYYNIDITIIGIIMSIYIYYLIITKK